LRIETTEAGTGKVVGDGESVRIHYVARLPDGTVLHDTRQNGAPIEIVIGSTKVVCGVEKALTGMRAGEQRRVSVPWQLAFGEAGKSPEVPARTDLVFLIDLYLPADPTLEHGSGPVRPPSSRGGGGRGGVGR
jgi:peptidylprolyl isomerase